MIMSMTGSDLRSTVARYEQGAIDIPPAVALLVDVLDVVLGVRGRLEIIAGVAR